MIPQRIEPLWDFERLDYDSAATCALVKKWTLAPELAYRLRRMAALLPFSITIFSGYRTCSQQQALETTTKASCDQSTHTDCPATGADIQPTITASDTVKMELGRTGILCGLRWGGGAPVDRQTGIPIGVEWHHFDLGPARKR